MISNISKKIPLITGAGTGIGLAVSQGLANEDYVVILAGRKLKKLKDAAEAIGENAYPLMMDISNPKSVFEGFDWIEKKFWVKYNEVDEKNHVK